MENVPTILSGVTEDDLIAALLASSAPADDPHNARTVVELAEEKGMHPRAVRDILRTAANDGRLGVARVQRRRIDGKFTIVPAYYLKG